MALKTYTAKAELIEGLKVRASARDFSVVLDEPLEQGGTNAGMNPIELALCSVCAWALRDDAAPLPPALAAQVLPLAQTASQQLRANVSPKLALTVCAMHCCAASLS